MVTVFTPDAPCSACRATKLAFKRAGVPFSAVVADDAKLVELKAAGFLEFPVVVVDCGDGASWSWSGYRHEDVARVKALCG